MFLGKIIFLVVILFAAYGLAVILLRRLTHTSKQLANLHEEMARSNQRLSDELRALHKEQERQRAQLEAQENSPEKPKSG